jgi:hypothetical protein
MSTTGQERQRSGTTPKRWQVTFEQTVRYYAEVSARSDERAVAKVQAWIDNDPMWDERFDVNEVDSEDIWALELPS